jgi:hypothetical protein
MKARTVAALVVLAGSCAVAASVAYRVGVRNAPPPPPPLPAEVVYVDRVKEIEVPVEVEGPVRVVEKVEWRTREVEVPKEVVREVIRWVELDGSPDVVPIQARVSVTGWKFEGLDDQGQLAAGWRGTASCEVQEPGGAVWRELIVEPFSLAESSSQSTRDPDVHERLRGFRQAFLAGLGTHGWGAGYRRRIGRSRFDWTLSFEKDWSGPSSSSVLAPCGSSWYDDDVQGADLCPVVVPPAEDDDWRLTAWLAMGTGTR